MLTLLVIFTTLCLLANGAPTTMMPEPAKCCTDHQYQATVGTIGGKVYPLTGNFVAIDSYTYMAYDYYRKRVGVETHLRQPNGTEKVTKALMDYGNKVQYIADGDKCVMAPLMEPMEEPCVQANATWLGSGVLGFGSDSINVNTWEYPVTTLEGEVLVKRTLTKDGCVPVTTAYYGTINHAATDAVMFISGFKPGIDKPSDLNLPPPGTCTYVQDKGTSSVVG